MVNQSIDTISMLIACLYLDTNLLGTDPDSEDRSALPQARGAASMPPRSQTQSGQCRLPGTLTVNRLSLKRLTLENLQIEISRGSL
jgi:hypothetical protein